MRVAYDAQAVAWEELVCQPRPQPRGFLRPQPQDLARPQPLNRSLLQPVGRYHWELPWPRRDCLIRERFSGTSGMGLALAVRLTGDRALGLSSELAQAADERPSIAQNTSYAAGGSHKPCA